MFPTCIKLIEFSKLKLDEDSALKEMPRSKGTFLVSIGTKEGKVLVYRIGQVSHNKLLQTKAGVSFGEISDVDMSPTGQLMIASTETGEILLYDLLKKLNEE